MPLTMGDHTNTPHVTATNNHGKISGVKLDKINDLASFDLQHYSIVHRNHGIRIADGATVMCDKVRDTLGSGSNTSHLTELVLYRKEQKGFKMEKMCFQSRLN